MTATAAPRQRPGLYGWLWRVPMLVWQALFFIAPLCFLLLMTFWLVKNYRMVPGFDTVNWIKMFNNGSKTDSCVIYNDIYTSP